MVGTVALSLLSAAALAGGAYLVERRADFHEAKAEAAHGPLAGLLDVDGTPVHAYVTGNGPDIVMLHGASGNLRDFTFELVDLLKDDFRVIAFDRPGLGWTGRLAGHARRPESPQMQARFLQRAAEMIGVTRPIVLGHSFGGAVALAWALERPQDTSALVLLGAVSNPWPGGLSPLYHVNSSRLGSAVIVPLITAIQPNRQIKAALESIFAPQPVPEHYARHVGPGLTLRRNSLRANAQQIIHLRPQIVEMSARYHTLTMPVEILHGVADTIVPLEVHSEPLSRQAPDARLTRMPGIGHMPHHAAPQTVVEAIRRAAADAGSRKSH